MDASSVFKRAAAHLGLWVLAAVAGLVLVGAGVALGGLSAVELYQQGATPRRIALVAGPGLALLALGVLAWRFLATVALLATVVPAVTTDTATRLDTETMKSDILSVLDERLADMHEELSDVRRAADGRVDAPAEFEFGSGRE